MKKYEVVYGNNPPIIFEADGFNCYGAVISFYENETVTRTEPRFLRKPRVITYQNTAKQKAVFTAPTNTNYGLLETLVVREL